MTTNRHQFKNPNRRGGAPIGSAKASPITDDDVDRSYLTAMLEGIAVELREERIGVVEAEDLLQRAVINWFRPEVEE